MNDKKEKQGRSKDGSTLVFMAHFEGNHPIYLVLFPYFKMVIPDVK